MLKSERAVFILIEHTHTFLWTHRLTHFTQIKNLVLAILHCFRFRHHCTKTIQDTLRLVKDWKGQIRSDRVRSHSSIIPKLCNSRYCRHWKQIQVSALPYRIIRVNWCYCTHIHLGISEQSGPVKLKYFIICTMDFVQ